MTSASTLASTLVAPLIAQYQLRSRSSKLAMPSGNGSPIMPPASVSAVTEIATRAANNWPMVCSASHRSASPPTTSGARRTATRRRDSGMRPAKRGPEPGADEQRSQDHRRRVAGMPEVDGEPLQERNSTNMNANPRHAKKSVLRAKCGPARELAAGGDRQQDQDEHQAAENPDEPSEERDALLAFGSHLGGARRAAQNIERLEEERWMSVGGDTS